MFLTTLFLRSHRNNKTSTLTMAIYLFLPHKDIMACLWPVFSCKLQIGFHVEHHFPLGVHIANRTLHLGYYYIVFCLVIEYMT